MSLCELMKGINCIGVLLQRFPMGWNNIQPRRKEVAVKWYSRVWHAWTSSYTFFLGLNCHNSTPIFSRVVLYCFTLKCWDGLQKVWSLNEMQSSSTEQAKNIAESERYIFRVFCYRAEAVSSFHLNCPSGKVSENRLLKEAFNFLFFAFSGFLKIQETLPLMIVRSVIFLTVCMFIHRAFRWKITTQLAFMLGKP